MIKEMIREQVFDQFIHDEEMSADFLREAGEELVLMGWRRHLANTSGYFKKPHATSFTHECAKHVAYAAHGVPADSPPDGHGRSIFVTGDMGEAKMRTALRGAGLCPKESQRYPIPGWDKFGGQILVSPDDVVDVPQILREMGEIELGWDIGPRAVIEYKTINDWGFRDLEVSNLRTTKPGYFNQVQLEIAGAGASSALFLAENKNSQVLYEEWIAPDEETFKHLTRRYFDTNENEPEKFPRPYATEWITNYHAGKEPPAGIEAVRLAPRINVKGNTYGWDEKIGEKLDPICAYCQYRQTCWPNRTHTRVGTEVHLEVSF